MKASNKLLLVVIVIVMSAVSADANLCCVGGGGENCWNQGTPHNRSYVMINRNIPIPDSIRKKSAVVQRSRTIRENPSLKCGENALCGTLPGTFEWIYGEVGIYYFDNTIQRNVFVPVYVKEAALSDGEYVIPYMIPKWDGKVFWMNINPKTPRLWIQPFYLDDDPGSCTGCMKFISRAMLCRQKGKDYTDYPYEAALMYMYVTVDADFNVKDYTVDLYDQDDNLPDSGKGLKLAMGDLIQTLHIEDDGDDASTDWNYVRLEDADEITQEPQFEYAGYIPGRDFTTTYSDIIDLPQTDLVFRVAGYVHDVATNTEKPTYSQLQPMGKLRDNVCAAYPQLTTANPGLADVVEGLRILAALAPQHFCFRDVNGDNKFDMAEVVWMLQKIAGLRQAA